MLNRLFSTIKRGSKKIGQGGYTLIEVAAVVAITATLAAVVVPVAVEKINEGKETSARQDCQQIGAAIASFYRDTGIWPAKSAATPDYFELLRTGAVGDDPPHTFSGVTKTDEMEHHLVVDNNEYITDLYNWKGPYIESLAGKKDPWGHNYLAYVKAFYNPTGGGTGGTKEYAWIISAGPNGIVDTDETASTLISTDDIGLYIYAAETGN